MKIVVLREIQYRVSEKCVEFSGIVKRQMWERGGGGERCPIRGSRNLVKKSLC